MKRKIRYDRIIMLILGLAAVIFLVYSLTNFGLSFFKRSEVNDINPTDTPVATEEIKEFSIDLIDYTVYKPEEVDFNFIVARLRFKDIESINYSLGSLYTDEKTVKITDYEKYANTLESKEIYLGARNINYQIKSDKNSEIFSIFIPVSDKTKKSLTLYDAVGKNEIIFDLTKNIGDISDLQYHTGDDSAISTEDYSITITNAYIENSFYQNGNEYNYPSTVKIYTFVLDINSLSNKELILEDAIFIANDSSEEVHALDASITSMKINNLISKKVKEGNRGALFFEMYKPEGSSISYNGTLKLKFSNSENYLSIKTELK